MPTIMIDGKKHTPGSNTLKKLKKKAKAAKAAEAPKKKKKAKAVKPPIPKDRPKKGKAPVNVVLPDSGKKNPRSRVDTGQAKGKTADDVAASPNIKRLKGKVDDLPSKKRGKKGHGIAMGKYRLK